MLPVCMRRYTHRFIHSEAVGVAEHAPRLSRHGKHLILCRPSPHLSPAWTQLAHMLGNQKPSTLCQVEQAIWRLVMRVSSGSTAEDEVEVFLQEFSTMTEVWEGEESSLVDYHFFHTGKPQLLCLSCMSVNPSQSEAAPLTQPHVPPAIDINPATQQGASTPPASVSNLSASASHTVPLESVLPIHCPPEHNVTESEAATVPADAQSLPAATEMAAATEVDGYPSSGPLAEASASSSHAVMLDSAVQARIQSHCWAEDVDMPPPSTLGTQQAVEAVDRDVVMTSEQQASAPAPTLLPAVTIIDRPVPTGSQAIPTSIDMVPPSMAKDDMTTDAFIESILDTTRLAAATEDTPVAGPTPQSTPSQRPFHHPHAISPTRIERMFENAVAMQGRQDNDFVPLVLPFSQDGEPIWDITGVVAVPGHVNHEDGRSTSDSMYSKRFTTRTPQPCLTFSSIRHKKPSPRNM
jgi:hypothetical protein